MIANFFVGTLLFFIVLKGIIQFWIFWADSFFFYVFEIKEIRLLLLFSIFSFNSKAIISIISLFILIVKLRVPISKRAIMLVFILYLWL